MATNKKQRITLFLNPSIAMHAKAQAIVEDITLTSFVEKALINHLPHKTVIKKIKVKNHKK